MRNSLQKLHPCLFIVFWYDMGEFYKFRSSFSIDKRLKSRYTFFILGNA